MIKSIFSHFMLVLLLLCMACSKIPLPSDKLEYEGTWEGKGHLLIINRDGGILSVRQFGSKTVTINGRLRGFQGDNFEVGPMFFSTTFEVNNPPNRKIDGKWYMVVDGVELIKKPR